MRTSLVIGVLAALLAASPARDEAAAATSPPDATHGALATLAAHGPAFLENGGRLPAAVDFTLDTVDRTFFFGRGGVTISLRDEARPGRWVLKLAPEGAVGVRPEPAGECAGFTSIFHGTKDDWRVGLRSFERLTYRDLWPGIDLVWSVSPGALKWECRVRPGADASAVRFSLTGAETVAIGADGALTASTPFGDFVDAAPVSWQTTGGVRTPVDSAFVTTRTEPGEFLPRGHCAGPDNRPALAEETHLVPYSIGVRVGEYDRTRELVVDPSLTLRTTFLGGASDDFGASVAVDGTQSVYVAGSTRSPEASFPETVGPDLTYNGGTDDAYVAKLDSAFRPVWIGYLGGSASDGATSVAVDNFGTPYVGGFTQSANFPIVGGLGTVFGGGFDAFVARISTSGRSLAWCGVFGGAGEDRTLAVAVDLTGKLAVAGRTSGGMPLGNPYGGGVSDGFVMGLRGDGTLVEWGVGIGGGLADACTGVAYDAARNVYVCGNTNSPEGSFPAAIGPDRFHNGGQDAWVAKLDATNHAIAWAGYIGGAAPDSAADVAVDNLGRAYVVGSTSSDATTFPVVVGPHLVHHGKSDAFVARVAADGTALEYCGYVGGTGDDTGTSVAVDPQRRAVVVGTTGSTERGFSGARSKFPVVEGDVTFNGGVHDGFVGVVPANGVQMALLGYVGGSGNVDDANAVALNSSGDVIVAGTTSSTSKTFPTGIAGAVPFAGGRETFVTSLALGLPSPLLLVPPAPAAATSGFDVALDFTDDDTAETGFEIERTTLAGAPVLFQVPSPAAATGPVHFLDTAADPGVQYEYRVRGVSATGRGEFSETAAVISTPSLALKLKKSRLSGAGTAEGATAAIALKYSFQVGSATALVDPVADGITVALSGGVPDQVFSVAPNDPAWITTGTTLTWGSPVPGVLRIVVDTARDTVKVEAGGLTLPTPQAHNPIRVTLRSGGSFGALTTVWRFASRGTRYRYP